MDFNFTLEEIESGNTTLELEELILKVHAIKGSSKEYTLYGDAVVDGEVYHNFEIGIVLEEAPESDSPMEILNSEWAEYDFLFDL